jgi:transketolase
MRDIFLKQLVKEAEANKNIVLITGDLGFKVMDEYREKHPAQFLNAGVAEQNMTGLAVGMALEGKIAITYSIANFSSLKCIEQIRNDACYHNANVKIISVGSGFSYGQLGISHHATEDISIMRALPDITICSPGCDWEVEECTKAIIAKPGTAYLRLDKASAGNTRHADESFHLDKARIIRQGQDVCFVTTGGILSEVLKAAEMLESKKIHSTVVSVHTIKPLDLNTLINAAEKTAGMIVVEEHSVEGGLASAVAENLMELGKNPGFFVRMGLKSEFSSVVGSQEYLRDYYKISARYIEETAVNVLKRERRFT